MHVHSVCGITQSHVACDRHIRCRYAVLAWVAESLLLPSVALVDMAKPARIADIIPGYEHTP